MGSLDSPCGRAGGDLPLLLPFARCICCLFIATTLILQTVGSVTSAPSVSASRATLDRGEAGFGLETTGTFISRRSR